MKNAEKKQNTKKNKKGKSFAFSIIGIVMLFVVVSVSFSSYTVWFGTTALEAKIMLLPQILFAAATMISVFVFAFIAISKLDKE